VKSLVESAFIIARVRKDPRLSSCSVDKAGEHDSIRVADLARTGNSVDRDQFVAGCENSYARLTEDLYQRVAASRCQRDVLGAETCPTGQNLVARLGLGSLGHNVFSRFEGAVRTKPNGVAYPLDVLQHGDSIGARGNCCAGHDLPC
jgi:hypothetical protein